MWWCSSHERRSECDHLLYSGSDPNQLDAQAELMRRMADTEVRNRMFGTEAVSGGGLNVLIK